MKRIGKVLSVLLALVMAFSVCSGFSAIAAPGIKSIKIISEPEQLKFYRGTDWDYGKWDQPSDSSAWEWVPGSSISFLRNPGSGYYKDAGMINANGLVIEIKYADGKTETMAYKETKMSDGTYTHNINLSPEKGAYKVGKMKVEVWLERDYRYYDTYEIEIIDGEKPPERQMGDIDGNFKINSNDALLVLQHSVSIITLDATQKKYADMNNDKKYNSSDALSILQKAVGK